MEAARISRGPALKLALAGASLSVALLVAWWLWPAPRARDTVALVDRSEQTHALLEGRARPARTDGPPPPFELILAPMDPPTAKIYFPGLAANLLYDELLYARHRPNRQDWQPFPEHAAQGFPVRTNSLGMREDAEPAPQRPDLRVLVAGDSHTDGVCANAESFSNRLEALLAERHPGKTVEVLNAGCGGYCSYNYLGALRRYGPELEPHVYIEVVYGGNDFSETVEMERYYSRRAPARFDRRPPKRVLAVAEQSFGAVPQELAQVAYFVNNPTDVARANEVQLALSVEAARLGESLGTKVLCVYLPPASRAQPAVYETVVSKLAAALDLAPEDVDLSQRMADAWLAGLREHGIASLDLRTSLGAATEPMYWNADQHLNVAGHARVAEALLPLVEELAGWR